MLDRGKVYNKIFNKEDWELVNKDNKLIMNDYLEEYKQRKMKIKTIEQYHNDLRIVMIYILKELDNKSILTLTKKDFRRFNLWMQEKNMSNARVNRMMSSVRSMLSYIEDDDEWDYDSNIAKKVKGLPKEAVRTDEGDFFLSFEQVMKVRQYLIEKEDWQTCALWMMFYDSGARRNEVHQVTKHNLSKGKKTNIVVGKRGKTFPLVYLKDTRDIIEKYLEERGEDDIDSLWISYTGKYENKRAASYDSLYDRIVGLSKILSRLEDNEINFFCHSLRHTRAEHLLQGLDPRIIDKATGLPKKFSLEEVQLFLHHSDPKTTQGYAKDHSEETIDNMFDED
jgi:integrase/recombinase XerD